MEHRKADVRHMAGHGAPGDDTARFLNELRQLRNGAGLGQAELAARAHYPYDLIRAAEVGPTIPDLPVLSAYVRGCGGTTEEWEERWRSLTSSPSLPVPTARNAGRSDAATAGARIGSAALDAETPDPSIIIAALNRVAEDMASTAGALPEQADVLAADDVLAPPGELSPSTPDGPPEDRSSASASAPEPSPLTSDQPPSPELKPAGWDPIRVSSAWPALRPSSGDVGGRASRDTGSSRTSRGAGRSGSTRPPAPWKTPPQWETAPWAENRAGGPAAGNAAPPQTPAAETPPTRTHPAPAGVRDSGVRNAGLPPSRTSSAAAPTHGARAASRGTGLAAGSPRTKVVVIAAVLLCLIAVLLVLFA